jgi:hypothetical protein
VHRFWAPKSCMQAIGFDGVWAARLTLDEPHKRLVGLTTGFHFPQLAVGSDIIFGVDFWYDFIPVIDRLQG